MNAEHIRLWRDSDLSDGMELLRAVCCSHRYPAHSHDEFVIAAFEGGAQRHSIEKHTGVAIPGTVMIIQPGQVHTGEAAKDVGQWAYRAFYPQPQVLEAVAADVFDAPATGLDLGRAALHDNPLLARQLTLAHGVIETSPDPLERQSAMLEAFAALIRRYGQCARGRTLREAPAADVRRAQDLIQSCFDERLSISQVASAVGLSEYHFMRSFRRQTGMTVHAYITQVRLQAAKDRLAKGMSAAQTAISVGFFDQSHFTNRFRASFGVTPGRFAEACR
ncbi:AraC family transcriptional regulator [Pseudomonas sp. DTU_2021_1001937_2_SI_NGA_ILE_001]|uniref:helix-turn-helix transcriptional regulator n=1 Tax=Pseudomonas sp. DTU_2021_1001937_2_SI_NGA_ILE_001 TaxID=3077589 RepID=UPI0028FC10BD|nr:AraC family transcriptional regulator [Pseudomonas sp. DTU_2021_1001937_2_SI_NGA_ILE_001]WNW09901.1 AraC family transcriptional regulator [Pseudomonas sp. DTU_2021_1001937_2_SI_NGA_ILE_001]